jgi:hypothetical protein
VDYDIPEQPAKNKVHFYRGLQKLRKIKDLEHSTKSVLCTDDKRGAQAVYLLVKAHGGHGHVYRAEKITQLTY